MRENVTIFQHPLITHKISLLRDVNTSSKQFRELVEEIAMLMAYEVFRDLPLKEVEIKTPIAAAKCNVLACNDVAIVPILRAGLGMVNGISALSRPQKSVTSGFTATKKRWNPTNITANCRTTSKTARSSSATPCLPRAARRSTRSNS